VLTKHDPCCATQVLEGKQGQAQAFKSVADRNRHIGEEKKQREGQSGKLREQLTELQDKITHLLSTNTHLVKGPPPPPPTTEPPDGVVPDPVPTLSFIPSAYGPRTGKRRGFVMDHEK